MDWLILLWTLFVCIVYAGGYLWPAMIGVYTPSLVIVYGLVLIVSAASWALRLAKRR